MSEGAISERSHDPIRVVVAEDSYMIREFLVAVLSSAAAIELVAVCSNVKELHTAIEIWSPDVVLTDIRMPPYGSDDGIRIAATLRETDPDVGRPIWYGAGDSAPGPSQRMLRMR